VQSWAFDSLYHVEKDSWALKSYLTVAQLQLFCFKRPEIPVSKLQKARVYEALLSPPTRIHGEMYTDTAN